MLECGGTSSNVSVVKGGRTVLRTLRVMGRLDRHPLRRLLGRRRRRRLDGAACAGGALQEVGPRSAHVAGLPYACFAAPERLAGAELELVAPRAGDPEEYAIVVTPSGGRASR